MSTQRVTEAIESPRGISPTALKKSFFMFDEQGKDNGIVQKSFKESCV